MGTRVGYIGLGNIGKPLAARLVPAGFETTVYDIAEAPVRELVEAGAKAASSPREVAQNADVIGICVPEDRHCFQVMEGDDGILAGAAEGTIVAIHSTVQPSTILTLAETAAAHSVSLLDAAVTGGEFRAKQGAVTYLVGGDAEVVEKIRPYLDASSSHIVHAGELANGAKLKLAINVLGYLQFAAAYESFSLAKASGLPIEVFEEAGKSNGQLTELMAQYLAMHKLPEEAAHADDFQKLVAGHTRIAEKDLAWALQLAKESGISLPVSGLVSQLMARIYRLDDAGKR